MMRQKFLLLLFLVAIPFVQPCADHVRYTSPVNYEITLAGNFGEPRPNHFHGGIDIKTGGVEGKSVFAIGDGYISRVTIGLYGFGNAVYIRHPEGYTSVYCHLQKFIPQIAAMVLKQQYINRRADGEFNFLPTDIPISKGQLIAISGNTGASTAPHLHLEIHETKTGKMLDPLDFIGHTVIDTIPPRAHAFMVYPVENEGIFNSSCENQSFYFLSNPIKDEFIAWGKVGFGVWANDYMQGVHNHFGIRKTELFVDDSLLFSSNVSVFTPKQNMQVNAWGDYSHFLHTKVWYMKSFIEPGLTLPILEAVAGGGLFNFNKERVYHFVYRLTDFKGNISNYYFDVKGMKSQIPQKAEFSPLFRVSYVRLNNFQLPGLQLIIPPYMLPKDMNLRPSIVRRPESYSDTYQFIETSFPLFDYASIGIRVNNTIEIADSSKLYVVCRQGSGSYAGGTCRNGYVWGKAREMAAVYELAYDDVPPSIEFPSTLLHNGVINATVTDSGSGLASLECFIDGEFVLFKRLGNSPVYECRLSETTVRRAGNSHVIHFIAIDNRNNKSERKAKIVY